jgi:hypothetical protein
MSTNTTGHAKITTHPDKDEIVEKLIKGESTRQVEAWLKSMYPTKKKLHVSFVSLQSFRKNYLKLENEAIRDLQKERKRLQVEKRHEQQQENVQKIQSYQVGLANYVQSSLLDYNAEILDLMNECKEGIKQLKDLNAGKGSHLNHQAITAYLGKLQDVVQMHNKLVSDQDKKAANRQDENVEQLTKKMEILVEAVKEAFNQTNPEGLYLFVSIVKSKMSEAGLA